MSRSEAKAFDALGLELGGKRIVEASAGTGKTYAITTLVVRLLLEQQLEISELLVVTFTEAATAELRDRVRARLVEAHGAFARVRAGEAGEGTLFELAKRRAPSLEADLVRLRRAIENVDDAPISTIHGFCQRVLRDSAFLARVPFDVELVPDLSELVDDVLYDFWQRRVAHAPASLARQASALGVDMPRLRTLFEHARRNPRVSVVPAPAPAATASELTAAFDDARARYAGFDLRAFMEVRGNAGHFGAPGARASLASGIDLCLEHANRAAPWVPRRAERCFAREVRALNGESDHAFFAAFERLARLCWSGVLALEHAVVSEATGELLARKLATGVLGFDDLLLRVAEALEGPEGAELARSLRHRYRAVLIDEFQDTDPVQFSIFERAFGDGAAPLVMIGDPKQAIYAFRGADVFAYLTAAKSGARYTMGTCYRSDPGVVAAVNALFRGPGRFCIPGIDYSPVTAKPKTKNAFLAPAREGASQTAALELVLVRRGSDGKPLGKPLARRAAARVTAADIAELLQGGASIERDGERVRLTAADVAVLARSNAQCSLVQSALRQRGIHSVVIADESVLASEEARELSAVLGAVLEPTSRLALRRAVATSLLGVTGDTIAEKEDDPEFWFDWVTRFRAWHELWVERGFMRMFRALLAETGAVGNLLEQPGGERALTNVAHLAELLHGAAEESHLGPAALYAWLADQRAGRQAAPERAEIRLESDDAAVKIMTVHKSKGLEFGVVYCPFLWDSVGGKDAGSCLFHDDAGRATLDLDIDARGRKPNLERAAWESFAEEVRVAYVALTRAKHRTVVIWGGHNEMGSSGGAWLLHPTSLGANEVPAGNRLSKHSDAELLAELEAVAAGCADIAVREVPPHHDARYEAAAPSADRKFSARDIERRISAWQRTSSFSSLIQHELGWQLDDEEGRDRDDAVPLAALAAEPAAVAAPGPALTPITLEGFPRGRRTGDLFHELLEHLDFATVSDGELLAACAAKLQSSGLWRRWGPAEQELRAQQVARALRETLDTTLLPGGPRLADVGAHRKFAELEFRMPVGDGGSSLTRARLAAAFREHPSDAPAGAMPEQYAERVERLGFRALRGFLKGYIDLVFEHGGRYYVVDYKTNHLGDCVEHYDRARMIQVLSESHYYLQYHLYALALHRHLGRVLKDYDYREHFGGALYLFIKGMRPERGAGAGVFFEKPPWSRMQALSATFCGAGAGG
ncbi:MAG: UvrD-helicase domain-containing protein [Polyangiaceae bacterium]|nr:UvrD-helicase domain-containing protein [Polyangiaceae bacterium]